MEKTTKVIAKELAPQLDQLVTVHRENFSDLDARARNVDALHEWFWDNKVGILRVMQAHAEVKG